jgi:hypothetical protein
LYSAGVYSIFLPKGNTAELLFVCGWHILDIQKITELLFVIIIMR